MKCNKFKQYKWESGTIKTARNKLMKYIKMVKEQILKTPPSTVWDGLINTGNNGYELSEILTTNNFAQK